MGYENFNIKILYAANNPGVFFISFCLLGRLAHWSYWALWNCWTLLGQDHGAGNAAYGLWTEISAQKQKILCTLYHFGSVCSH